MAGSHEVRGSIPLGSTTDPRGARRRRRAPLFLLPGTERAYRTKSVSHSGASARAGAPFSFARTRRPRLGARAESAPPPPMGIARPGRSRPPAPREEAALDLLSASRRSTAGRGRIRRQRVREPRHRRPDGGVRHPGVPLPQGTRATTRPSSPPTGPRRRGSPIGGRPPASAGSAASPTHASGGAAGRDAFGAGLHGPRGVRERGIVPVENA